MGEKLQTGAPAPDFETQTDTGETMRLSDYRGQKVVLYFYPKDDTPGCTIQACAFRDSAGEIEAQNAVVFGISPDGVESHQAFKSKFNLPFTLLVDEDHSICEAYGVWAERSRNGRTYMGVNRSQFVIDETGTLVEANYGVRPEESVPSALAALG